MAPIVRRGVPQTLGKYHVIAELAQGGMANVHLAETRGPEGFTKLVVLKELKRELASDDEYRQMFIEEARLAARLEHRHIVRTHELASAGDRWFMVMDLLDGASLQQVREKLGVASMPLALGVRVLVAVLDALHYAHDLADERGQRLDVVHRDVSANNVFLTYEGDVKLIDFGVAKSRGRRHATRIGIVKGSVPYMAPDHVEGQAIDRRADVFAAGVLLREMITGARLWGERDELAIVRALIALDVPAFPEEVRAEIASPRAAAAVRGIAERAMKARREERFQSAAEMSGALKEWLQEESPRVSLETVGAWLRSELSEERAAVRARVADAKANANASANAKANANAKASANADASADAVWLPSSELRTRVAQAPPLRARGRRWVKPALRGVVAAALVSLGIAIASIAGADRAPEAAVSPARARTVDDHVVTSPAIGVVRGEAIEEVASTERRVVPPALPELPPNPYE